MTSHSTVESKNLTLNLLLLLRFQRRQPDPVEMHGRASLLFGDIDHVLSVGVLDRIDGSLFSLNNEVKVILVIHCMQYLNSPRCSRLNSNFKAF